ncbi:MAG: diphosphomevalonate decarboxylase, partial [Thermoanaerobaculia bacterium]|nr:diphosphomevalonate decarboxylase [Thermoanaerobaculia bacterium]
MKASFQAPSNIAFVKYWGARDLERAIPNHPSISITLDRCRSLCTVEPLAGADRDEVWLVAESGERSDPGEAFKGRVVAHLDRLRRHFGSQAQLRVGTRNTFPSAAGIASSASGFAALTLATLAALELEVTPEEESLWARRSGSGSAARSTLGGYVEWPRGEDEESCYAFQLAPAEHWDLCDVITLVQTSPKKVSSLDGHLAAPSSPHSARRLVLIPERLDKVRAAIRDRDLELLGPVLEEEFIEMHLVAMSSRPAVFYWSPATLAVLERLRELRAEGRPGWATMDAGANVHVFCEPQHEVAIAAALAEVAGVERVLQDRVGQGPTPL